MSPLQEIASGAAVIIIAMAYFWKRIGEDPTSQEVEYQRQLFWGNLSLAMAADEKNTSSGCLAVLGVLVGIVVVVHGLIRWF